MIKDNITYKIPKCLFHIKSRDAINSAAFVQNNIFMNIPQTDTCHFSIVEKDTLDGFEVYMRGVLVAPADTKILTAPKWVVSVLEWFGWCFGGVVEIDE